MSFSIRELRLTDAQTILKWENDPEVVAVSPHNVPYELADIELFISKLLSGEDPSQKRFMICKDEQPIGTVDLSDISSKGKYAFVGVLIAERKYRRQGFARLALDHLGDIASDYGLNKLYAWIHKDNFASKFLFESAGYKVTKEVDRRLLNIDDYINAELYLKCLNA